MSASPGPAGVPLVATTVRTAVVWDVLSAFVAATQSPGGPIGGPLDIVDVGGGTGGFAVPLAQAGHRVTVVDPSPDALAALSRRAAEQGLADRVRAVQGDLEDVQTLVAADSADLVLCHSVLQMVEDPAAALRRLAALLRPGGGLSLLVGNRDAAVLARALAGRPAEATHLLTDPDGRWGPADGVARRWTPAQFTSLVETAGLVVAQQHGIRVVADLVPSAVLDAEAGAAAALLLLERRLADVPPFRDLATQLHVLARRP